jgi:hypothetical protein
MTILPAAAALALAGLAALPFALPGHARVARSAIVPAAPAAVYAILSTSAGFDRINPFRDGDSDLRITFSCPPAGVGAAFAWQGKAGAGSQTIVAAEPDARVAMQLDLGAMGRPVQTFTLTPVAGGTEVTWALDAPLGANPVRRVAGLFMDRMLGSTYEAGLANLARVAAAG